MISRILSHKPSNWPKNIVDIIKRIYSQPHHLSKLSHNQVVFYLYVFSPSMVSWFFRLCHHPTVIKKKIIDNTTKGIAPSLIKNLLSEVASFVALEVATNIT